MPKNIKRIHKKRTKPPVFPANLIAPIGKFLLEKEKELLRKMKLLKTEDPFVNPARLNDNASPDTDAREQIDHLKIQAIEKAMKRQIIQIRKALTRVKIGKYGLCEKCGKMIDTDRLIIYPEATICVKCKKKEK